MFRGIQGDSEEAVLGMGPGFYCFREAPAGRYGDKNYPVLVQNVLQPRLLTENPCSPVFDASKFTVADTPTMEQRVVVGIRTYDPSHIAAVNVSPVR